MTKSLPPNPSLDQLKHQAKDALGAHRRGDASVCELLRRHHRFTDMADREILAARVSLQEVQHALARQYGFKSWTDMKAMVPGASGTADAPSHRDVHEFFAHCAAGLAGGGALVDVLQQYAPTDSRHALVKVVNEVSSTIVRGMTFSEALNRFPQVFNQSCISFIAAGEKSGRLEHHMRAVVDSRMAFLADAEAEDPETLVKYISELIQFLLGGPDTSLTIHQAEPMPLAQDNGPAISFGAVRDRLKLMSGVAVLAEDPRATGRIAVSVKGDEKTIMTAFDDTEPDPSFTLAIE